MERLVENNSAVIEGTIVSGFVFDHEIKGEGFYGGFVKVDRISDAADIIRIMVSDRLLDMSEDYKGCLVSVTGQIRSFNRHEGMKNRLVLSVFAKEVDFIEEISNQKKANQIFLDGYVCKEPIYRKTPLGREIADLLIAVNRPYGKSDYIPCICWGRNARFAQQLSLGEHLSLEGRIQSRNYIKVIDGEEVQKTAYEVSISSFGIMN